MEGLANVWVTMRARCPSAQSGGAETAALKREQGSQPRELTVPFSQIEATIQKTLQLPPTSCDRTKHRIMNTFTGPVHTSRDDPT